MLRAVADFLMKLYVLMQTYPFWRTLSQRCVWSPVSPFPFDNGLSLDPLDLLSACRELIYGNSIRGLFRSHVTERVPSRAEPPVI